MKTSTKFLIVGSIIFAGVLLTACCIPSKKTQKDIEEDMETDMDIDDSAEEI